MKMTDDGWKCENCNREWKDGASFRRIIMAKREKENGSQSNARGH
jgi:ribosomal protein L37AE/L43A